MSDGRNNFDGGAAEAKSEANRYDDSAHGTGSVHGRQFAHPNDGDPSGGNMSGGKVNRQPLRLTVASFQGKSGQPDNQSTSRGKGRT